MTLDQTAVPPHPSPAQADRAGAPSPASERAAAPHRAGPWPRRPAAQPAAGASSAVGRLTLWAAGLRNLAGLVREHRRREREG